MVTLAQPVRHASRRRPRNLWFERGMAILAATNLALVVFDLTYVNWRNFWLQGNIPLPFTTLDLHVPLPVIDCPDRSVPKGEPARTIKQSLITCLYDPVKGIEPHRDTQQYLGLVALLQEQVNQQGSQNGLRSPGVQATLKELQTLSRDMVETNPFAAVGKTGTLEKIKNRMREHIRETTKQRLSTRETFNLFWSNSFLTPTNWQQELNWFNEAIAPLVQTNYYRSIGENGEFTNNFWVLDAPFVLLFFVEFLARTYYISRRYPSLRWLDAMFWRWYDILLFLPFSLFVPVLALTRVIPTAIRLHQAWLIDLNEIQSHLRQGFVATIAEEVAEVVVVQVINQLQSAVQRGELSTWLKQTGQQRYVDLNNKNEIEAIAQHLIQLTVNDVFPQVRPNLEALIRHSIDSVLSQSPAYRGLQALPGIGAVPGQITERLVSELTQATYDTLKTSLNDPKLTQLSTELIQNFATTLLSEAEKQNTLPEIQTLLSDLLEEIKINYVQRVAIEDLDTVLEQTRQLQQLKQQE